MNIGVVEITCEVLGIDRKLLSVSKIQRVMRAKQIAALLLREQGLSYTAINKQIGWQCNGSAQAQAAIRAAKRQVELSPYFCKQLGRVMKLVDERNKSVTAPG
jgi:hypothetical protein